jgi:YHS domain-containing protein
MARGVSFMTADERFDAQLEIEEDFDPVCESPVNADEALDHQLSTAFMEREYFFCSPECKREFERTPTTYAASGRSEP